MASRTLLPLLLLLLLLFVAATAAADVVQGPTPPPEATTNLTRILAKGEQYTTLLRLLNSTRVGEQLSIQLASSYDGLTLLAPTDAAFAKLRAGALNGLSDQQQAQLALCHVLPRYYSLATFQTASNPLRTEASGPGGAYAVNVTAGTENSLVNVSTGLVDAPLGNTMFAEFPLAVYSVDDVLLPEQMFGGGKDSSRASAPAPAQAGSGKAAAAAGKKGGVAAEPSAAGAEEEEDDESNNAAAGSAGVGWSSVAALALIMAVVNVVLA